MTPKRTTKGIEREYARWKAGTDAREKAEAISAWVEENDASPDTRHFLAGMTAPEFAWVTLSSPSEDEGDVWSMRRALKAHADERSFHELRRDHDNFSDLDLVHYFWITRFLITGEVE